MSESLSIAAAFVGGILPALAWLWFWLREDDAHPEPRRLIALAFLTGMVAVAVAVPLEKVVEAMLKNSVPGTVFALPLFIYSAWSVMEEIVKFALAYATVLRRREDDEPIDPVIYMVTVALGFAGAENVLFSLSPLSGATLAQTIITGDLRFIGATLLHILSSAAIGVALGLSFYAARGSRIAAGALGVLAAAGMHVAFNILIMNTPQEFMFGAFSLVWIGIVALLGVLEYVKRIRPARARMYQ